MRGIQTEGGGSRGEGKRDIFHKGKKRVTMGVLGGKEKRPGGKTGAQKRGNIIAQKRRKRGEDGEDSFRINEGSNNSQKERNFSYEREREQKKVWSKGKEGDRTSEGGKGRKKMVNLLGNEPKNFLRGD